LEKKILFIDMDGVLVDFGHQVKNIMNDPKISKELKDRPDLIKNIFLDPPPIDGAIDAINKLKESKKYELFIATTAPWNNPPSFMHKRLWVENYFGDIFKKRIFITSRKDLLVGDFLIDDRLANGAGEFKGELLRFGWDYERKIWNEYKNWNMILDKLI
jgi:5'(3')-deoxyribonucleotidase